MWWRTLTVALSLLVGLGCATSRGTLDVRVALPPNPESGLVFQAPEVTDARHFEPSPRRPSIPSLKNAGDISNAAITSRAIARKRNGYGMALGDILLPEGRSVQGLAGDAIIRAFRSAGFAVALPDDPGYADAIPVRARIDRFWAWVTPGFWAMAIEFEARVHVATNLGDFANGKDVRGYIRLKSAAVSSEKWQTTIDHGLENFSQSLAQALTAAHRAGAVSMPPR